MSMIDTIKADCLKARKERTPSSSIEATLLTTIIGEAQTVSKADGIETPTDEIVAKIIKRFLDKNVEFTNAISPDHPQYETIKAEHKIISRYAPVMMTEAELRTVIDQLPEKTVPAIMSHLKANYAGKFDGKMASTIARSYQG